LHWGEGSYVHGFAGHGYTHWYSHAVSYPEASSRKEGATAELAAECGAQANKFVFYISNFDSLKVFCG